MWISHNDDVTSRVVNKISPAVLSCGCTDPITSVPANVNVKTFSQQARSQYCRVIGNMCLPWQRFEVLLGWSDCRFKLITLHFTNQDYRDHKSRWALPKVSVKHFLALPGCPRSSKTITTVISDTIKYHGKRRKWCAETRTIGVHGVHCRAPCHCYSSKMALNTRHCLRTCIYHTMHP